MNKQQLRELATYYKDRMPESVKILFDVVGFEGLCVLSERYGGLSLYIPKQASLFLNCMKQSILDEYDGSNLRGLSVKYGVSERLIYRLLEKNRRGKVNGVNRPMQPIPGRFAEKKQDI